MALVCVSNTQHFFLSVHVDFEAVVLAVLFYELFAYTGTLKSKYGLSAASKYCFSGVYIMCSKAVMIVVTVIKVQLHHVCVMLL